MEAQRHSRLLPLLPTSVFWVLPSAGTNDSGFAQFGGTAYGNKVQAIGLMVLLILKFLVALYIEWQMCVTGQKLSHEGQKKWSSGYLS